MRRLPERSPAIEHEVLASSTLGSPNDDVVAVEWSPADGPARDDACCRRHGGRHALSWWRPLRDPTSAQRASDRHDIGGRDGEQTIGRTCHRGASHRRPATANVPSRHVRRPPVAVSTSLCHPRCRSGRLEAARPGRQPSPHARALRLPSFRPRRADPHRRPEGDVTPVDASGASDYGGTPWRYAMSSARSGPHRRAPPGRHAVSTKRGCGIGHGGARRATSMASGADRATRLTDHGGDQCDEADLRAGGRSVTIVVVAVGSSAAHRPERRRWTGSPDCSIVPRQPMRPWDSRRASTEHVAGARGGAAARCCARLGSRARGAR